MQIFLICVHFLVYFCVYFFTRVFHTCFSHGLCVQYGGFPRMKPMCNAAMPGAFTVDSEDDYCTCKLSKMSWSLSVTEDYTRLMIIFHLLWVEYITVNLRLQYYCKHKCTSSLHMITWQQKKTYTRKDERLEKLLGQEGIARWKKKPLLNCSTKCSKLRLRHSKY